jgi:hypothetical protein
VSVEKFLKQRAVNIAVGGSYTLANWYDRQGKPRTFACRTTRVSPFRMLVQVPVIGKIGSPITSYFNDFGKLEGVISDTTSGAFLLELEMARSMREKFASKLTWLEKKLKDPRVSDVRKNARIRSLHRPRCQTFAQWLCSQVRRKTKPQRSQPADRPTRTGAAFRKPCKGCALVE